MPKNRSAGIVIKDNKVLIMHRIKEGDEYYVFPGGGVEMGETPEQAVIREISEETTINVVLKKFIYHITWDNDAEFFYYLCDYISGEAQLRPDSEEFAEMQKGNQVYEPMWIEIDKISDLKVYQLEVRDLFLRDYKNGFPEKVQELVIKVDERRHK